MAHTLTAISAGIVLALGFSAPVAAESLEDAVAAYRSADYATALRLYRPLAEQGLAVAQFTPLPARQPNLGGASCFLIATQYRLLAMNRTAACGGQSRGRRAGIREFKPISR